MLLFSSLNYPESDSLLSESGSTDSKTKLPSKSWKRRSMQRPVTDGGCTEGGLDTHTMTTLRLQTDLLDAQYSLGWGCRSVEPRPSASPGTLLER